MANSIVDVDNAPGNLDELEKSLTQAVTADAAKKKAEEAAANAANANAGNAAAENTDPLAGTKFEGKSVKDVLDSYKNLESLYGRMANDLGTQRKLTDRLLDLKRDDDLERNSPAPKYELRSDQLLDNPNEALDRWFADREARTSKTLEERLNRFEATLAEQAFTTKHPDYMQLGQSQDFQAWTTKSPSRQRVAAMAARGDLDAADALFTEFKDERKSNPAPANRPAPEADLAGARKAALESANSGGQDGGSARVYRRADLIQLKINKPDVYGDPEFQKEILKAYSEGRVK